MDKIIGYDVTARYIFTLPLTELGFLFICLFDLDFRPKTKLGLYHVAGQTVAEGEGIARTDKGSGKCLQCGKIFSRLTSARRHFQAQHLQVICPLCSCAFYGTTLLEKHERHVH
jgi:hypothetical protein